MVREIHAKLLARGRGSRKEPGEFRRSQNWIGGSRPGDAVFVPPPHAAVPDCVSDLERFLTRQGRAIHPFLDGNGRVGRLLITLVLCQAGVLRQPLPYLSLYLKQNRADYHRLLDVVRKEGDWEAWVAFFLEGVAETADGAVATARRLVSVLEEDPAHAFRSKGARPGRRCAHTRLSRRVR